MPMCSECSNNEATHPYLLCKYCFINPVIRNQYRNGKGVRKLLGKPEPEKKPEVASADV